MAAENAGGRERGRPPGKGRGAVRGGGKKTNRGGWGKHTQDIYRIVEDEETFIDGDLEGGIDDKAKKIMKSDISTPVEPIVADLPSSSQGICEASKSQSAATWADLVEEPESITQSKFLNLLLRSLGGYGSG